MIGIRPGFGGDVDLARGPAEFRRIHAGLNLEFLQRVDRREKHVAVEVAIRIFDAVEREAIEFAALAGDADVLLRPLAALNAGLLASRAEPVADIRAESHKLQEIAAIQRQIHDPLVLDDGSRGRALGSQHRGRSRYIHHLVHLPHLHVEINARDLLHLQLDAAADDGLEPLHFRPDPVGSGKQRWEGIGAGGVGDHLPADVRTLVRYSDRYTGHRRAGAVGYLTRDLSLRLTRQG